MKKNCLYCNNLFEPKKQTPYQKFCSYNCQARNWKKNNKEKVKASKEKNYLKNREHYIIYKKEYYYKNKKRIKKTCLECGKEYIQNRNYKFCSLSCGHNYNARKQYHKNHSKSLKRLKKYRDSDKGKLKRLFLQLKRQRKLKYLNEDITYKEWKQKLKNTFGVCPICNKFVGIDNLTKDHIIPITKAPNNFTYTINDVQPMCISCNSSKGNKITGDIRL